MIKGAWWVDSPAAVATLEEAGFRLHIIPYINDRQVDVTLAAMSLSSYAIVLLQGDPAEKERQVTRLAGRNFFGYITHDEPNVSGTLLTTSVQREYYQAVKRIDPWKQVIASYHLEPDGLSYPEFVVTSPYRAWDYAALNYYPATWGRSDKRATANLRRAVVTAGRVFPTHALILSIQQAAGCTWANDQGRLRPIPGLLQAQQDIWAASGVQTVPAIIYYGWGTNPEDSNLQDLAVLAEAASVT